VAQLVEALRYKVAGSIPDCFGYLDYVISVDYFPLGRQLF
jgi:hypothetical protein